MGDDIKKQNRKTTRGGVQSEYPFLEKKFGPPLRSSRDVQNKGEHKARPGKMISRPSNARGKTSGSSDANVLPKSLFNAPTAGGNHGCWTKPSQGGSESRLGRTDEPPSWGQKTGGNTARN